MSINLQRSPRQTQFWKDQTPLEVGPGSYLPGEQDSFNREHMAPFNTSAYRKFGHRNENPGPGSYDWKKDGKPNEDLENKFQMPTKNFSSKVARLAPVIPGSSIYKESTIVENPAPGTYHQEKKWNRKNSIDRTRDKLNQTKHKDFVLECAAVPPSIPNRKVPNNSFTGKGLDRPGPTDYEPKDKSFKLRSPETNFSISKTERKLFEPNKTRENNLPPREIPGPGTYQGERQKSFNFNCKSVELRVATGQNFTFLSKSPNCQQIKTDPQSYPGPGCYELEKEQSPNPKVAEAEIPSFLSNTIREGMWTYDAEAPFTKPDRMGVPGPGQYSVGKKYEDLKTKILLQEAIRAPFNSSGLRECMKGIKTSTEPGPGEYIDPNNTRYSSFYKSLLKNAYERAPLDQVGIKTGAFGSNQKRFEKSVFDGKAGPGPGQYEQVKEFDGAFIQPTGEEQEKKKPSFEFKSTQARFKQRAKVKTAPDVGVYNPHKNEWMHQTRSKEYSVFGGRSIGFDATAPRAKRTQSFFGHLISENPGPGNYEAINKVSGKPHSLPRNKNLQWGVVFNSCESRFKPGTNSYHLSHGTQKNVGPGSYIQTQNSMLKKSFNMTMEHSYFL